MRDWEKRGGAVAVVGVALAALGGALRLTHLGAAGLGVLGAGVICWGLSGVLEGRMSFSRPGARYSESYYGLAARAWGVIICLAGTALVGCGLLLLCEPDMPVAEIAAGPLGTSFGLLLGGLVGMLYAVTLVVGRAGEGGSRLRRAMSVPRRLLGAFLFLACAALAVTGVVRVAAPQTYEGVVRAIRDHLPAASRPDRK